MFYESYRCCWGRGPRRGNLGPEKQRAQGHMTVRGKARLGPGSVATQGWKHEEGPGTPGAQRHSHPPSNFLTHPLLLLRGLVCTLQNFRAKWSTYFILWESTHIHFPSFSPSPTAFGIVTDFFKSKDLTREYKNISLAYWNGSLSVKIYNLIASQVLLMNSPHLKWARILNIFCNMLPFLLPTLLPLFLFL